MRLNCEDPHPIAVKIFLHVDWLRTAQILALLILSAISTRIASAQFSGPALGTSTDVNLPITLTIDPRILFPTNHDLYLGTGDVLSVHLYGNTDYAPVVRISLDGAVQLPLIGTLSLRGLTLPQAQDLIAHKLKSAGMFRDPQVSIQITESPNQTATVIGELRGIVPISGEKRLLDVLAAAGAASGVLPPTASHIITINRYGAAQPIVVDLGTDPAKSALVNIPIFPRDTIIVPRVGVVYLLGAFKVQGAIPLAQNSPITLMKLAALGGGPGFEGRLNDLRIICTTGGTREIVHVDIRKVINGEVPDPILHAEDIVFLPTNPMKAAIKSGGISTLLGIASILVLAVQQ